MPMTLRLSAESEALLEELAASNGLSKTAVIEQALQNWNEHASHRAIVRAAIDKVDTRDKELLERLSR